jgi:alpha-beta hydrolase superfamily lysophospholipase
MDFDPEPSIAAVDVPTLLLYGTDDLWLPVEDTSRRHHPAIDVAYADAASHDLTRGSEPARETEERLLAWLDGYAGGRG